MELPKERMAQVEKRIQTIAFVEKYDKHDTEVFKVGYLQATLDALNKRI